MTNDANTSNDDHLKPEGWQDDWNFLNQESLEHYVQSAVDDGVDWDDVQSVTIRKFPKQAHNAIKWIKLCGIVEATNEFGHVSKRHPGYVEVYIGCVQCGLKHIEHATEHYTGPSVKDVLLGPTRNSADYSYDFVHNRIMSPYWQRFDPKVTRKQMARIRQLSDTLVIDYSTIATACFVQGLCMSDEWIPEHDEDGDEIWNDVFADSISDFIKYVNAKGRD